MTLCTPTAVAVVVFLIHGRACFNWLRAGKYKKNYYLKEYKLNKNPNYETVHYFRLLYKSSSANNSFNRKQSLGGTKSLKLLSSQGRQQVRKWNVGAIMLCNFFRPLTRVSDSEQACLSPHATPFLEQPSMSKKSKWQNVTLKCLDLVNFSRGFSCVRINPTDWDLGRL